MATLTIDRRDIGYTVCSRIEQSLRSWLSERLTLLKGDSWRSAIPRGLWDKAVDRNPELLELTKPDPSHLLEELDLPDVWEIAAFKKASDSFLADSGIASSSFQQLIRSLYDLRIKIAHVKHHFSAIDLDLLLDSAGRIVDAFPDHCLDLAMTLECLQQAPEKVVLKLPSTFTIAADSSPSPHLNNLPPSDYASDGGFVGRKEDLVRIEQLVTGALHRVITISGAGGVGKSALAHKLCTTLLDRQRLAFDAIVWTSAKEEQLSDTGIEPLEPSLRSYEDVLDAILDTYHWNEQQKTLEEKAADVEIILTAGDKGMLLVVDNLETIRDEHVKDFLKDFPPPSKVLITSRLGLGEVERRVPIKELKTDDAVRLLRTVAREKGAANLASLADRELRDYVDRMARYPLAIKWVIGQVALGQDINVALGGLTASSGDVAKFCFEHIFDHLLSAQATRVMFALAAVDHATTRGVLAHVADMPIDELDNALRDLSLASLILTTQKKRQNGGLETQYELLSLTRNYVYGRLRRERDIHVAIRRRAQRVEELVAEASAARAGVGNVIADTAAVTAEEKIAATWAMTAAQKAHGGDYDGAIQNFQRAVEIAPEFSPVLRAWAQVEAYEGFYERAEGLMKRATTLSPSDAGLWSTWGYIEKRRARYDRAAEYLRRAQSLEPSAPQIKGALGEIEKRRGNYAVARKLLLDAAASGSQVHKAVCMTMLADNQRRWAQVLTKEAVEQALGEALTYADRAIECAPGDERALEAKRRVCVDLGGVLWRGGRRDAARPLLEAGVRERARSHKEKKTTQVACYLLLQDAVECGDVERARRWLSIGKRNCIDKLYQERYRKLGRMITEARSRGRLIRVVRGRGFGFLEDVDNETGTILVHVRDIVPAMPEDELAELVGREFGYVVEPGKNGPRAVAAALVKTQQPEVDGVA